MLDNSANHSGKENTVLEDWLWEEHRIFVLFLPARTPEWNPIELVWNILEERLKHYDWRTVCGTDRVVKAAATVLNRITHKESFSSLSIFFRILYFIISISAFLDWISNAERPPPPCLSCLFASCNSFSTVTIFFFNAARSPLTLFNSCSFPQHEDWSL